MLVSAFLRRILGRGAPTLLFLALLFLAGPALRAEEPPAPPPGETELPPDARMVSDPAALTSLFADRTVHGAYIDGVTWREFSAADGRTIWENDGCLRPGTWRVSGSVVCYTYPSWDEGRPQCFVVYRSAAATHFIFLDGRSGQKYLVSNAREILDGNPDGLPIDLKKETCGDLNT